jgi:hypothetical protein
MTELAKQENKAMALPAAFQGFTEEEALGGMSPIQEGYLKSFKYFLSRPSTLGKFQIVNNATDEVVWEGDKIEKAVIYYGHEVMRLKRGHVEAHGKNEADFTEEENEILAVTYDPKKSKGNFESNGYGEYLTNLHKDIQGKMTRLYLVMIIPSLKDKIGVELVAASFSVTTSKSFRDLVKQKDQYGVPLPFLYANIGFKEDKSEKGQVYQRIVFDLPKDANGFPLPVFESREQYLSSKRGLNLLNEIILTHKGAVENAERSGFGGEKVVEAPASGSTFGDYVKEEFHGTDVDPASVPNLDEEEPF